MERTVSPPCGRTSRQRHISFIRCSVRQDRQPVAPSTLLPGFGEGICAQSSDPQILLRTSLSRIRVAIRSR